MLSSVSVNTLKSSGDLVCGCYCWWWCVCVYHCLSEAFVTVCLRSINQALSRLDRHRHRSGVCSAQINGSDTGFLHFLPLPHSVYIKHTHTLSLSLSLSLSIKTSTGWVNRLYITADGAGWFYGRLVTFDGGIKMCQFQSMCKCLKGIWARSASLHLGFTLLTPLNTHTACTCLIIHEGEGKVLNEGLTETSSKAHMCLRWFE